jgi:predicted nucleotidyltransferase
MATLLPSAQERKQLLDREIERYVPVLIRLGARKIILVGSLATNRVHALSDVDLIVVLETGERFLDRLERLHEALDPQVALDLFVYTPGEFEEMQRWSSFLDHALANGKVLYDGGPTCRSAALAGAEPPGPR